MDIVHLERVEHDKNLCRFYRIAVVPTLFGEWALLREWGRIGSPGTVRETWFQTEAEAITAGRRLMNQKMRKGYLACSEIALNERCLGQIDHREIFAAQSLQLAEP